MDDVVADQSARWRTVLWGLAACLFLLPLVAMQFTTEVVWDAEDFLVFGTMLVIACGAYEVAVRATRHRLLAGGVIAGVFLLVWAELAVGIFR